MVKAAKKWLAERAKEVSTYVGAALTAASVIGPQFAAFDVRFAYVGAAAGFILIVYKETRNAG